MYAWSSDCCVEQAGRKGLVNLFGTLGWQGTCRQGKVPAQSYVSTAAVLEYRLHCNTRDMEGRRGESRGMVWMGVGMGMGMGTGMGMGMGQGPGPRPRPGTGDWGLGMGIELGPRKQEKVGSRLGGAGEGVWLLVLEVRLAAADGRRADKGWANDRTTSGHFTCSARSRYDDVQQWSMCRRRVEDDGRYARVSRCGRWL